MKFTSSLIKGKLIKRYKRFFADIEVNNKTITAHCPNTGSMMGLLNKGNKVWYAIDIWLYTCYNINIIETGEKMNL